MNKMNEINETEEQLQVFGTHPFPLLNSELTFEVLTDINKNREAEEEIIVTMLVSDIIAATAALHFTVGCMDKFIGKEHKIEDYL